MSQLDPNRMGRVLFDAFLAFMTKEAADTDTVDQMIDSFRILAQGKVSLTPSIPLLHSLHSLLFQPFITGDELRRELPSDQANYCMARMAPSSDPSAPHGSYDYVTFSQSLYIH